MTAVMLFILALGIAAMAILANASRPCTPQPEPEWRAPAPVTVQQREIVEP